MRARRLVLLLSLVLLPPAAFAQGAASCPATAPDALAPFDSTKVASLAGVYEVELVDTTSLRGPSVKHRGRLTLWLQDTPPSRPGLTPRPLPSGGKLLAGAWDAQGADTGSYWQRMAQRDHRSPGVIWTMGFLRLGDFGSSGLSLYVTAMSDTELRGRWNSGSGMGVTVDFTGARTPESAGYYCARRLP
ncbi:MAG: hypothetical protein HUU26_11575 [Gemmatimonadaceae bacterium]|nr:hypothetical protein [Gemmatimonadaceae bacterium]